MVGVSCLYSSETPAETCAAHGPPTQPLSSSQHDFVVDRAYEGLAPSSTVPSVVCSSFLFTGPANLCACCHFLSVSRPNCKSLSVLIANLFNESITPANLARSRSSSLCCSKSLACLTFRSMAAELRGVGGTGGGNVDFACFSGSP